MAVISVIVPVYNVEKVLSYCIDSILNQTFKDFELLLINDGSPDNSGKICDEYAKKDNRIKVYHNENKGVSYTRNFGVSMASCEYICFVDSDDYVQPEYLDTLLRIKNKYPFCDNIWCGYKYVTDYQQTAMRQCVFCDGEELSEVTYKNIMTLVNKILALSPCNKLYKRSIIEEYSIQMPEDLSLGEDLIFNLKYLDKTNGDIIIINQCLYNYIYGFGGNLVSRYYEDLLSIYKRQYDQLDFYIKKWNAPDEERIKNINDMCYKYLLVLNNTFNKKNTLSFIEKLNYNKKILKSSEMADIINQSTCKMSWAFKRGYKLKMPLIIYLHNRFLSFKQNIYNIIYKSKKPKG